MRRPVRLLLVAALVLLPGSAGAAPADGSWTCHSFGKLVADFSLQDDVYILFTPAPMEITRGEIAYTGGEVFAIVQGDLLHLLGLEKGTLGADSGGPLLTLETAAGERLACRKS